MARSAIKQPLTIGRLAEATGVNIETIRYYEKIGMLAKPARTDGGHRHYAPEHAASLEFIRRCRDLGFPLEAVRDLMRLGSGAVRCEEVRTLTVAHRDAVRRKIADLKRLDRALTDLIDDCTPARWPECPIMDSLKGRA